MEEGSGWVWDSRDLVYFHPSSNTYAVSTNGEWSYVHATEFKPGEPSSAMADHRTELEEGEVRDDVGWGALIEGTERGQIATPVDIEVLRLVIISSDILTLHKVIMIDGTSPEGIQIGRDKVPGPTRVRLKEMAVSKTHAVIFRQGPEWCIVDLGSTHGTFVVSGSGAAERLSPPKHASQPHPLKHLDKITIGSTTVVAHLHPDWPCDACQINGDNMFELFQDTGKRDQTTEIEISPRYAGPRGSHEMSLLRKSLLKDNGHSATKNSVYVDRSALRRQMERPSSRRSASPPRLSEPSKPASFAARMLGKQGWVEGKGLGAQNDGIAEPLSVKANKDKRGLGDDEEDWRIRGKKKRWRELE
ncbi:hypothetical protein BD324DRAFT_650311 [Kockovaella imperatae]|uniref:SMAD/FHA domain-containing protein n=1 Tax=Kockovaella imperatae TaxID=4999 RepID=A0A1Y1UI70_9TREE|nr:hypothetical protein BD324DRAFT_650311 [Kockovaella imperatae]ORX37763.1 hypothetical protein BD324DRAFT_650311 [Kockovaella imperatae]